MKFLILGLFLILFPSHQLSVLRSNHKLKLQRKQDEADSVKTSTAIDNNSESNSNEDFLKDGDSPEIPKANSEPSEDSSKSQKKIGFAFEDDKIAIKESFKALDYEQKLKVQMKDLESIKEIKGSLSIYYDSSNDQLKFAHEFKKDQDKKDGLILCASGLFSDSLNQIGWDKLYLKTFKECDPIKQLWAAGFIEGALTYKKISYFYSNLMTHYSSKIEPIQNFYQKVFENLKIRLSNANMHVRTDDDLLFYGYTGLYTSQLGGLLKAINIRAEATKGSAEPDEKFTMGMLLALNADGQISDLADMLPTYSFDEEKKGDIKKRKFRLMRTTGRQLVKNLFNKFNVNDAKSLWREIQRRDRCSVFVKPIFEKAEEPKKVEEKAEIEKKDKKLKKLKKMRFQFREDESQIVKNESEFKAEVKENKEIEDNEKETKTGFSESEKKGDKGILKDFLMSHSSWDDYSQMMRFFKRYEFDIFGRKFGSFNALFSSYAGCISSTDDWFQLDQGLVVTETTIENLNADGKKIMGISKYVPDFIRFQEEWFHWFEFLNTGTYNSQWIVLDMNKAKEAIGKSELVPHTFAVMEQSPDRVVYQDLSKFLMEKEYFAAYNVPFDSQIRADLGYKAITEALGPNTNFVYENNERGQLFKCKQKNVNGISELKDLMEWNPHCEKKDECLGEKAFDKTNYIGSRYDLEKQGNFGKIDTKVVNIEMFFKNQCQAISGPTHTHNILPFCWSLTSEASKYKGLPDFEMSPEFLKTETEKIENPVCPRKSSKNNCSSSTDKKSKKTSNSEKEIQDEDEGSDETDEKDDSDIKDTNRFMRKFIFQKDVY